MCSRRVSPPPCLIPALLLYSFAAHLRERRPGLIVCPDSVTFDWATATLKDNTAGTTSTVLAKTCTNSGTWKQVTKTVTAGHSLTLTLVSHDENNPGDPTYTLYDDVTLQ